MVAGVTMVRGAGCTVTGTSGRLGTITSSSDPVLQQGESACVIGGNPEPEHQWWRQCGAGHIEEAVALVSATITVGELAEYRRSVLTQALGIAEG